MISLIKTIFLDIIRLYKNFLHWNISKLIFSVYGIVVGVLLSIVPLIFFGVFLYFSHLDLGIVSSFLLYSSSGPEFLGALFASPVTGLLSLLMLGFAAIAMYIGIWYGRLFLSRMSMKYITAKKIKYFKKSLYLKKDWLSVFVKITLWIFLFMVLGFLLYVILFIVLTLLFGGLSATTSALLEQTTNAFSRTTLALTLVFIGLYLYYGFRVSFSYLCFIDATKKLSSPLSYIKKSFKLTSGWRTALRFVTVFFLVSLVLAPVKLIGNHFITVQNDLVAYGDFKAVEQEIGKQELSQKLLETNIETYDYYSLLAVTYGSLSYDDIKSKLSIYNISGWVFNILYFFLIYGVLHMAFVSFYIRELKKK